MSSTATVRLEGVTWLHGLGPVASSEYTLPVTSVQVTKSAAPVIGLVPIFPTIAEVGTSVIPVFVKITKLPADRRSTGAGPGAAANAFPANEKSEAAIVPTIKDFMDMALPGCFLSLNCLHDFFFLVRVVRVFSLYSFCDRRAYHCFKCSSGAIPNIDVKGLSSTRGGSGPYGGVGKNSW
jgi:hypothetical protein